VYKKSKKKELILFVQVKKKINWLVFNLHPNNKNINNNNNNNKKKITGISISIH